MSDWDTIRAAIDAAETDTNAAEDGLQAKLLAAQGQAIADAATIATLRAQLAALQPSAIRWGSSLETRGGTATQALAREQAAIGPVTAARYFDQPADGIHWPIAASTPKPNDLAEADMAGIALLYSCKPDLGEVVAGKHDADLRIWCQLAVDRYKKTGIPTVFTMWHEADVKIRKGVFTTAAYKAAAEHLFAIINNEFDHAAILPAPIFTKYLLDAGNGLTFADLWPAGSRLMGWDVYKPTPKTTVPGMLDPLRAAAKTQGLPWGIFETGVNGVTHTPAQRLAALTEIGTNISAGNPKPWCVSYFNSLTTTAYNWAIDDEPDASAAWKAGRTM